MSSVLATIPKLNSTNYKRWSQDMESYLHAIGIWQKMYNRTRPADTEPEAQDKWDKNDNKALGAIALCLEPSVASRFVTNSTGKSLWDSLKQQYDKASLASTYTEWKIMLGITFPDNNHPGPVFSKLNACFAQLELLQHKVPNNLKALITVAKLPKYAETLHQALNAKIDVDPTKTKVLTMPQLESVLVAAWQHYVSRRPPPRPQANKVSNVHRQQGDPSFQQQQQQQQKKEGNTSEKKDEEKGKGKKHRQGKRYEW